MMRRAFLSFYGLMIVLAMASCAVVCTSGCAVNETDRAAPNLIAHHRHERLAVDHPEWAELMATENAAVEEYYNAIRSGDEDRFPRAKKALADAVGAVDKAGGGK